jgi:hypothetical protein
MKRSTAPSLWRCQLANLTFKRDGVATKKNRRALGVAGFSNQIGTDRTVVDAIPFYFWE